MKANKRQQEVLDILSSGYTGILNIIGEGGTGKSWLIDKISKLNLGEVEITATTGIASLSIGGRTIHSYLQLEAEFNDDANDESDAIRFVGNSRIGTSETTLIIDESSMMGKKLFTHVLKSNYKLLILIGDKQQLCPVKDEYVDFSQYRTIELTDQMRTKSSAYKLIGDYRLAKENNTDININDYVDGDSVESISFDELKEHYDNNISKDKRVISYTNASADMVIDTISPSTREYQLLSRISVYDGSNSETLAVNGDKVIVNGEYTSYRSAMRAYGRPNRHRTKWNVDYPFEFKYVSFEHIDTPFVKFVSSSISRLQYKEVLEQLFKELTGRKSILVSKYNKDWKDFRSDSYMELVRQFMALKNNIVLGRHICSMTAHKAQGSSIDCVYIVVDNIGNNKALMYVALSRAINKIVLIQN